MSIFSVSELFISIEGEFSGSTALSKGFAGTPTVYVRLTGCNKTCAGFNNPENLDTRDALSFDPSRIAVVQDIPEIIYGCDSIYSWHPDFAHMWKSYTTDELIDQLELLLPNGKWTHPLSNMNYILSLTGGEPLMHQKQLSSLLIHPRMKECKHILFETNGSVPLIPAFKEVLINWCKEDATRLVTFSISPKLSASGETWKLSIRPKVINTMVLPVSNVNMYFKFVCDANEEHFEEVYKAMEEYWNNGISKDYGVGIMPVACTEEQQRTIARSVALMCIKYGFSYSHRIQNTIFNNEIGT